MSPKTAALLVCLLVLPLAGCGSESNRLYGSIKSAFGNLPFQHVEVFRQEYQGQVAAYHVRYVDEKGNIQVRVTAKAPVVQGQEKDLVADGQLAREVAVGPGTGSQFPEMESGKLIFDTLGDVGSIATGRFYVTFVADPKLGVNVKNTLDGDFSATLQKQ